MKRPRLIVSIIVILLVLFLPMFKIVVVPAWTIRVVDEQGKPQSGVDVRQHWNHYSFDGSSLTGLYGGEEAQTSDSNGKITFPERSFRTGLLRWAFATIGTPLRWINVHASTGPHSFLICSGERSCHGPSYKGDPNVLQNTILTVESEETIRKPLEKIRREYEAPANPDGLGSGGGLSLPEDESNSAPHGQPPPPPKPRANR